MRSRFRSVSDGDYFPTFSAARVRDSGVQKSLDAELDQIAKKSASSDYAVARNVVNAFLTEVSVQNGKHLSSEAYAPLYFKGKYLLENLPPK